jgi:hypothetical protein
MLITESIDGSFVPRPPDSPRRSVAYGPRSAFEGSLARPARQSSPGVTMGSLCSVSVAWPLTAELIVVADSTAGG